MKTLLVMFLLTQSQPQATPIETRIGLHRTITPAIFLTLQNKDEKLSIRSVVLGVSVIDPIKRRVLKTHVHRFTFANAIKPREVGEAVVTSEDGFMIRRAGLAPAQCKGYEAVKDTPSYFMPRDCAKGQDILTVTIYAVEYADGSRWVLPEMRRN